MDVLLSVAKTCRMLGIGRTLFYETVAVDPTIAIHKIGRRTLVSESSLEAYIRASRVPASGVTSVVGSGTTTELSCGEAR